MGHRTTTDEKTASPGRGWRLVLCVLAGGAALLLVQGVFSPPVGAVAPVHGPSVYINTYVPGESFTNTVLYVGAWNSVSAARASTYVETREPRKITQAIKQAAVDAGEPLTRVTIASHGKPGGVMLDRADDDRPEQDWLLAPHTLLDWLEADVASAVSRDATIVFEACDTSPMVNGAPAAEATAFRRAVARTFDVPPENVVLFRGPAKYAWGLDGWRPRTYPLEIVFGDVGDLEGAA